jgi:hypothetical protein
MTAADCFSNSEATYARELGAAVTALGNSAALLDVQKTQVAAGGLNNSGPVGASVVAVKKITRQSQSARVHSYSLDVCFKGRSNSDRHSRVAAAVGDSVGGHFCW